MESSLRQLIDRQKISDVLSTYCRGVDRCDVSLVKSAYHVDSFDDRGYWRGSGHEFAEFVVDRLLKANSATTHSITNILIDFQGAYARSEAQVMATLVRRDTSPVIADVIGGRYVDRLSQREGVWRIEERTVVLDWHKVETWHPGEAPFALDDFYVGKRGDRSDPIFTLLSHNSVRVESVSSLPRE